VQYELRRLEGESAETMCVNSVFNRFKRFFRPVYFVIFYSFYFLYYHVYACHKNLLVRSSNYEHKICLFTATLFPPSSPDVVKLKGKGSSSRINGIRCECLTGDIIKHQVRTFHAIGMICVRIIS
jgi:hypothetical protein